uniref:HTH psq-type domain-containing protein n=1 Tax=Esox lucius TaxID=8010 RepID=A0A3P9A760_ESOLU
MPPKRPASAKAVGNATKLARKVMTLEEKVKVLDMLKQGQKKNAVARQFGVNESTIQSIHSCEKAIRESVATSVDQL